MICWRIEEFFEAGKLASDKPAVFRQSEWSRYRLMAEPTEPKKETVRIALTPPSGKPVERRETVRITLPSRPPASNAPLPPAGMAAGASRPPVARPLIPPAPDKPVQPPRFVPPPISASAKPSNPAVLPPPSPKKETARITVLPDPPPAPPSVQMKKTQPLVNMPAASVPAPVSPITVPDEPQATITEMPMAFCWALVGVSAVVLLIQILNYIS